MPTFGNRVTTTTQDYLMPMLVDTVLNSNVFAKRMLSKAKKWRGETLKFPVKTSKNTTGSSFSGFDTLTTTATNNRVNLSYTPSFYKISASLPLDELSVNASDEKVLDFASVELSSAAQDMADDIGTLFYGDGTGNGAKDFLGLGALVDDGTSVATIGGQSRSTYTSLQSTVTASGGTLSLAKMATLFNAVASGSVRPTAIFTTETIFSLYEQLLQPQERITKTVGLSKGLEGGTGFVGLDYKGVPVLADEKCTSGAMIMVNEDFIDFMALPVAKTNPIKFKSADIKGNEYSDVLGLGFSWSDWILPSNQAAVVSHIYLGGNLVTSNPKRHGKLTGITGV